MADPLVRSFCVIAHIDHGKSTLAGRFLELTRTLTTKEMQARVLDDTGLYARLRRPLCLGLLPFIAGISLCLERGIRRHRWN